jgi:hypothetical protein
MGSAPSIDVLEAVRDFQRHIARSYRSRLARWREARQLAERVADAVLDASGGRSVRLLEFARLMRVKRTKRRVEAGSRRHGSLAAVTGGFELTVSAVREDSAALTAGMRYVIAHELGHTLFYDWDTDPPKRIIPTLSEHERGGQREERLCDYFGGALLMPRRALTSFAAIERPAADVVDYATRLNVTPEMLVRRLLYDLKCWPSQVWYRLDGAAGNWKVKVFRGHRARVSTAGSPTASELGEKLRTVEPVCLQLELARRLGCRAEDVARRAATRWVRVQLGGTSGKARDHEVS